MSRSAQHPKSSVRCSRRRSPNGTPWSGRPGSRWNDRGDTPMIDRRRLIAASAAVVLSPAVAGRATAQSSYPSRYVRLVVPFPPGGGTDAIARVVSVKLSEMWGQNMVVENRGGGATNIGTEAVARADPDGYTIL